MKIKSEELQAGDVVRFYIAPGLSRYWRLKESFIDADFLADRSKFADAQLAATRKVRATTALVAGRKVIENTVQTGSSSWVAMMEGVEVEKVAPNDVPAGLP